jgi:hypothetical protein
MLPRRSALTAMVAAALLSACTPMQWERGGQVLDYADSDWSNCRSQSVAFANRWNFNPFPYPYGFAGRGARGRQFGYFGPQPYPDRFMLEREYFDNCLRTRGFQLVPVPAASVTAPRSAPAPANDK